VQVGSHLLSLVPDEDSGVQPNFEEAQVGRRRDGQKARLPFDAFADPPVDGRIDSLFAASGPQFSLLPPDNAPGNCTTVVQRIP
ncbi:HlyD family secretion protein, partial [Pseudomonas aeruginosa]